jgi:hypothetical protein
MLVTNSTFQVLAEPPLLFPPGGQVNLEIFALAFLLNHIFWILSSIQILLRGKLSIGRFYMSAGTCDIKL